MKDAEVTEMFQHALTHSPLPPLFEGLKNQSVIAHVELHLEGCHFQGDYLIPVQLKDVVEKPFDVCNFCVPIRVSRTLSLLSGLYSAQDALKSSTVSSRGFAGLAFLSMLLDATYPTQIGLPAELRSFLKALRPVQDLCSMRLQSIKKAPATTPQMLNSSAGEVVIDMSEFIVLQGFTWQDPEAANKNLHFTSTFNTIPTSSGNQTSKEVKLLSSDLFFKVYTYLYTHKTEQVENLWRVQVETLRVPYVPSSVLCQIPVSFPTFSIPLWEVYSTFRKDGLSFTDALLTAGAAVH